MNYNEVPTQSKRTVEETMPETTITQQRKHKAVVSKPATIHKKSLLARTAKIFLGTDDFKGVRDMVIKDIILPSARNMADEAITSAVRSVLYGKDIPPRNGGYSSGYSYGNYGAPRRNYTSNYRPQSQPQQTQQPIVERGYERGGDGRVYIPEYMLPNHHEALVVLDAMKHELNDYGKVTCCTYKDLIGIESFFTDNNYGWTNLSHARVVPGRGGYVIQLPPVEEL
ncbi:MAG: hypothetical protein ACRCVU_09380 [Flavobacterium sp.]